MVEDRLPAPALVRRLPPGSDRVFRDDAVAVTLAPAAARFILRGGDEVAARLASVFGAHPPARPLASAQAGTRAALWLGPDEWLLLAPDEDPEPLGRALQTALDDIPASLVDVSQRQIGLNLSGPLAARLLSSGCPLDLAPAAFPPGMVARTLPQGGNRPVATRRQLPSRSLALLRR
jgi:sarcosine oxidase subunit gamma